MWGSSSKSEDSGALEEYYTSFLLECVNLTTLALYFRSSHFEREWTKLRDAVLTLMTKAKLHSLVFYDHDIYDGSSHRYCERYVHPILQTVAASEMARARLKSLCLALPNSLPETEALVQSRFPNLEVLIIKKTFQERPNSGPLNGWKRLDALTRLKIYYCMGIKSSNIPKLVALFPRLRELLVSGPWGQRADDLRSQYPVGWHLLPDALCNTHQPLEWIHIGQTSNPDQISFIGVIPTKRLIVTDNGLERLMSALKYDVHLFPGMQFLQYSKTHPPSECGWGRQRQTVDPIDLRVALNEWCAARKVEVTGAWVWENVSEHVVGNEKR
jgi:hypothetical protein